MNSSTAALVSPSIAVLASGFSSVLRDICLLSNLVLFFLKPSSMLFIILVLCSLYFGHTSRTCSASSLPVPQSQLGCSVSLIGSIKNLADLKSIDLFNWELTNVGGCREGFELLHNLALVDCYDWYNHEAEEDRMRTKMSTSRMKMACMKRMILMLRVL